MTRTITPFSALIAVVALLVASGPAGASCADDIKALQGKASQTDATNKPGEQKQTNDPQTSARSDGGGTASASAKILEAQAFQQKGDEANCTKAIGEAKALTDGK